MARLVGRCAFFRLLKGGSKRAANMFSRREQDKQMQATVNLLQVRIRPRLNRAIDECGFRAHPLAFPRSIPPRDPSQGKEFKILNSSSIGMRDPHLLYSVLQRDGCFSLPPTPPRHGEKDINSAQSRLPTRRSSHTLAVVHFMSSPSP